VDYGMGNLHSAHKALQKIAKGLKVGISSEAKDMESAKRVVLPGVGAIGQCMKGLRASGLDKSIHKVAKSGRAILAICIGMQMLFERSDENGGTNCLGLIPGKIRKFASTEGVKVPHMGWNRVQQHEHAMWKGIEDTSYFYFVHSYYVPVDKTSTGLSEHGVEFASAVGMGNIFGTQFHPEKSGPAGLRLLSNFLSWNGHHSGN
jgi:glutamine amidotransferase